MTALVFDTSPLSHFAKAGELDTLAGLTGAHERFVTLAVLEEADRGVKDEPSLGGIREAAWLAPVRVDGLNELAAFAEYARVLGAGARDVGEASTLAWAEVHRATAIIDERAGTRRGRAGR